MEKVEHETGGQKKVSKQNATDQKNGFGGILQSRTQNDDQNRSSWQCRTEYQQPLEKWDWNEPKYRHRNVDAKWIAVYTNQRQ